MKLLNSSALIFTVLIAVLVNFQYGPLGILFILTIYFISLWFVTQTERTPTNNDQIALAEWSQDMIEKMNVEATPKELFIASVVLIKRQIEEGGLSSEQLQAVIEDCRNTK